MLVKKAMAKKRFTFPYPDNISDDTKKFMRNIIKELREKMDLEQTDMGALNMLMTSYELYLQATENLLAQGPTKTNRFGEEVANPNQIIATKNYNQVLSIMKEYGLTIKARKNLKMNTDVEEDSPLEQFMKSK